MRPAIVFVHLACCLALCIAFYPFQPAWLQEKANARALQRDGNDYGNGAAAARGVTLEIEQRARHGFNSPAERAERDAGLLARKYGGPRSSEMNTNGAVTKRMNQYRVQEAVASEQPLTAGIDQDGTDYAYFIKVELGSKRQPLYMLLDTGAGSSWVMGSGCTDKACAQHDTFKFAASDTFHATSKDFSVTYGSGAVQGKLASDTLTVAGVTFDYSFGLASTTSSDFMSFPFDGILGLSMSRGSNDNFLEKMTAAHKLEKNIFCVTLNRAADGLNQGEIKFGSTNPAKFTGDITYTPLSSEEGEWAIQIDDIAFDGKKAEVGGIMSYIDTGTSFIFGPMDKVEKIHRLIPGAKSPNGQIYTVPCDMDKALTFTFSGVDYKVYPQDWISPKNAAGECTSNLYGHDVAKGSWLIGDTFLMNVYSVFDKDEKRIGFANLASSDSKSASSSGSGPIKTTMGTASSTATPSAATHQADNPQSSGNPAGAVGGQETPSGVDEGKPKETSDSAAIGDHSRVKSQAVVATLMAALVVVFA
ncbi:eukaryotic aspartyl protease [Hirsutella rhossiliensis]|uniref:Eukaryotic aspartyl protease domain-containing protein n=1 Tax=Hirsutella rhossiliensis TaxID=111463 RepID=A0A9P8SNC4_9HYPO|nr:eukaryotic aspartyl protease domain-containing protein [Hirsutella rhossiliensis]KAH0968239.1 eukaryotic aspartyl protease domain-containing protein [Hirsutella rhossiliensis]